ncbi:MAG TPA: hypothetical protein VF100_00420 [Thermoanaerobaculia bacterium]
MLVALSLAALAAPAAGDNLPIVEQSIAFHGGEVYARSEISFKIVSRSGSFDAVVRHDGGRYRHAVTSETEEGLRTVVVTNDTVEVRVDGEPRPVPAEGERRWRDFVSARVWFPLLPFRLADAGVRQRDLGLETWPATEAGGEPVTLHRVKVTFDAGGDEYLFWFDAETGRLEKLAYRFAGGLRFREAFGFRRVGGVLFADHRNLGLDWDDAAEAMPVDVIDPRFVSERLAPISTIRLEDVEVTPLPAAPAAEATPGS